MGNWLLYIAAIPYSELSSANRNNYEMFMNGHHVIHRSDLFWAGVSIDLAIRKS